MYFWLSQEFNATRFQLVQCMLEYYVNLGVIIIMFSQQHVTCFLFDCNVILKSYFAKIIDKNELNESANKVIHN